MSDLNAQENIRENPIRPYPRSPHGATGAGPEGGECGPDLLGLSDDDEVEQGRLPKSRHQPPGVTPKNERD